MRAAWLLIIAALVIVDVPRIDAQTGKATRKAPQRTARKVPELPLSRIQAEWRCNSELGLGVGTGRRYCDVLTGNDPREGVLITIPPHRGPVTMTFELHNRHTYSAELVKMKQAYRKYTATIGVLTLDNTLVERAVVMNEFRTEKDLFDRIGGGAGPGGVKAVAPTGVELIRMELPADVQDQVSVLGEKLTVVRPGGVDNFSSPGRPIATISNVMLEFRPGPPPKKTPPKKTPQKKP
jgi:hypothetical protein